MEFRSVEISFCGDFVPTGFRSDGPKSVSQPRYTCAADTRCFSAVAELLVHYSFCIKTRFTRRHNKTVAAIIAV